MLYPFAEVVGIVTAAAFERFPKQFQDKLLHAKMLRKLRRLIGTASIAASETGSSRFAVRQNGHKIKPRMVSAAARRLTSNGRARSNGAQPPMPSAAL